MAVAAMTHVGYVAAGWAIPLVAFGLYGLRIVLRGRRLAAQVAPKDQRWS